jgi:hypothetical protein
MIIPIIPAKDVIKIAQSVKVPLMNNAQNAPMETTSNQISKNAHPHAPLYPSQIIPPNNVPPVLPLATLALTQLTVFLAKLASSNPISHSVLPHVPLDSTETKPLNPVNPVTPNAHPAPKQPMNNVFHAAPPFS